MFDILNKPAGLVFVVTLGMAFVLDVSGVDGWISSYVAVGIGTSLASALERQANPSWRPRVFWVFPLWLGGLAALGIRLVDTGHRWLGGVLVALAALGVVDHTAREARNPHGELVVSMTLSMIALLVITGVESEVIGDPRWWTVALRAVSFAGFVISAGMLWLARRRDHADSLPETTTTSTDIVVHWPGPEHDRSSTNREA
jgi:hypothetical protein